MNKLLYQNTDRYFAMVADDIKDLATDEIQKLGATDISPTYRGLYFSATAEALYRINYCAAIINRILAPLMEFDCHSDRYLYRQIREFPWEEIMRNTDSLAIFATVVHSNIKHSRYAALKLKDAIVDRFRERTGKRPMIDRHNPDLWLNLFIRNNHATISIDTSGGSLHRRGYRQSGGTAPMIETLAAALIRLSEWDGRTPLTDPFCGSGTILAEAYLKAGQLPPNLLRRQFGFQQLPDYSPKIWAQVKREGRATHNPGAADLIRGSDFDGAMVAQARHNLNQLPGGKGISIQREDIFDREKIEGIIITNPPYGKRLSPDTALEDFYRRLGDFLKQRCQGATAFIYFGERKYLKSIGLRPSWKKPIANGGLDGRLAKFELY